MEFQDKQQKLQERIDRVNQIKGEIEGLREQQALKLQNIASLTKEEAKEELIKQIEQQSKDDLMARIRKMEMTASEAYEDKAREIIMGAIQRTASSHAAETTSTAVSLPNDEMKGRIIGKEGRNIKAIEKLTGCELIIDETPETIMVSGFSPIRRQVAKLALEKLMADGRIQPARIEEFVEKAKQDLALDIKKAGEESLYKMGITGIDPKLVGIVGRLKYRTSYGQNILNHSMETAYLSALIAEELGLDAAKAKKCGFFHDIGKSVDQETQGSHPEIGYVILKNSIWMKMWRKRPKPITPISPTTSMLRWLKPPTPFPARAWAPARTLTNNLWRVWKNWKKPPAVSRALKKFTPFKPAAKYASLLSRMKLMIIPLFNWPKTSPAKLNKNFNTPVKSGSLLSAKPA